MTVERTAGGTSVIDVLDRVLDGGIVIDALGRVPLVRIDRVTVDTRVGVASIDTHLMRPEQTHAVSPVPRPQAGVAVHPSAIAENADLRTDRAHRKLGRIGGAKSRRAGVVKGARRRTVEE